MKTRTLTKSQAGLLTLSALALGLIAATQEAAAGNISNTKHNLSSVRSGTSWGTTQFSSGVGDIYAQTGSDQICVFCHTPHGAVSSTIAPLWNRTRNASGAYSLYQMTGSNSTGTASIGGMSMACLSCHDGTQAMDAMLNAPGFGGAATGGTRASIGNNTASGFYTWSNTEGPTMNSNGPALIGTDLTNDHPIGMLYCGGGVEAAGLPGQVSATCADADFMSATSGAGTNKSYVVGSTAAGDIPLKLYGSSLADSVVQCGTCHDPHLDNGRTFLRQPAAGSKICLTCHTK